jgi:4-diphosphocytidyl-2-C-methyl-D-erythritol kinase
MPTRVRSHAKINLGLAIGPPREDGYHALATIYQTLAVHDWVEVTAVPAAAAAIRITCSDGRVPCDATNTCWRAVELAMDRLNLTAQVAIHIEKRLPMQGGLGAGSANAAAALMALERELGTRLPRAERLAIAAETGSDVPLFLVGGTVLGLGRGEEVYPLPDLPPVACVVAIPAMGVSTPQAFRDWDQLQERRGLTGAAGFDRLRQLGRDWAAALSSPGITVANATGVFPAKDRAGNLLLELVRAGIENDFEQVVFSQYPSLRDILENLKEPVPGESSAVYAALSGSGSALFGLYATTDDAAAAAARLRHAGITALETALLPRGPYWAGAMQV